MYGVAGRFRAAECGACGLWFQNPSPVDAELSNLYPAAYGPHALPDSSERALVSPGRAGYLRRSLGYHNLVPDATGSRDWRSLRLFDVVRHWTTGCDLIPRYVAGGSVLELGCGSGARLRLLRRLGWHHVQGVEFVPEAAARARAGGCQVMCESVEKALGVQRDQSLDAVVSSMLLEHVRNPFDVVRQVARTVKPGGQFLFSTITRDSLDARLYGQYWAGFDFPRHLVYLATADIVEMLEPWFDHVELFYQPDPIDFVRASTWRSTEGSGRLVDRLVLALGTSPPARLYAMVLAFLRLTCRVSVRCRRKCPVHA